jgi:hypothetical protein
MDSNLERDYDEERYNGEFCPACGDSPCTWNGNPDGFHTDDGPDPAPAPGLQAPQPPERTARQLAAQLNRAGLRGSAVELLAASPGLRPHVARLMAGRCEDARQPGRSTAGYDALARRLRQWADEEETWQAGSIADAIILEACAEFSFTGRAFDLAVMAVLVSPAFARPMDGSLLGRPRRRQALPSGAP